MTLGRRGAEERAGGKPRPHAASGAPPRATAPAGGGSARAARARAPPRLPPPAAGARARSRCGGRGRCGPQRGVPAAACPPRGGGGCPPVGRVRQRSGGLVPAKVCADGPGNAGLCPSRAGSCFLLARASLSERLPVSALFPSPSLPAPPECSGTGSF